MRSNQLWTNILRIGLPVLILLSIVYYFVGKEDQTYQYFTEDYSAVESLQTLGELGDGAVVTQSVVNHADYLKGISLRFANFGNVPEGEILIEVSTADGTMLANKTVSADQLPDSQEYYVNFDEMVSVERGETVEVTVKAQGSAPGKAVTLWTGEQQPECALQVNGQVQEQMLYLVPDAYRDAHYTAWYWGSAAILLVLFTAFCLRQKSNEAAGRKTPAVEFGHIFDRYQFLMSQLVSRDFKTKYRRSYLGILWSLLNPLFMMIIVSSVFSFVFRYQIENFQVYLILGQVMFNFFSEATQVGVTTIIGSGQLIKKVYLPKYIFPLSKTVFSFLNFLISFIAVAGVLAFYRIPLTLNIVYLPVVMVSYFCFTLGIALFLSAMMVFLRDTQHFYGLFLMGWSYLTPIFYPVSSLADWMQKIMQLNPLYHYITYLRTILLYGTAPSVAQNVVCVVLGILSLTIGVSFFFKRQGKFILYI